MFTLNIIGAGSAGKVIAKLLAQTGIYSIQAIVNRSYASAIQAQEYIGSGTAYSELADLPAADLTLIAVVDDAIKSVAEDLAKLNIIRENDLVLHLSGALSSAELECLSQQGARVASLHPVYSFADPEHDLECFPQAYCSVEGDSSACLELSNSFKKIGCKIVEIKAQQKLIYHSVLVLASNCFVGLMAKSVDLLADCDIEQSAALGLIQPLVESSLRNVFKHGPKAALTGPIQRGELDLVNRELEQLICHDPDAADIYKVLGKECFKLAASEYKDEATRELMYNLLYANKLEQVI